MKGKPLECTQIITSTCVAIQALPYALLHSACACMRWIRSTCMVVLLFCRCHGGKGANATASEAVTVDKILTCFKCISAT